MSGIPLRITEPIPSGHGTREPGMMWRYPPGDVPGRECWWIVLPNWHAGEAPGPSEVSWRTTDRASSPPHEMWQVSGDPPVLTVTPSVDVERWLPDGTRDGSYWHGFIRNGVLEPA
jgi:hypothetical protein